MATTKYLDHGLYPVWTATPAAGVCQDGDGTAIGTANVATASIDLSAYTASAGNTITIGGALLTCVASGAGANQFNAGSGTTLATNLATAINQTSNTNVIVTTGASNPMLGWSTNTKLQDMLYATASGTVLNLQTRMGSAAFNASSFFSVISSGLTGGTLNAQFSGGAGGAWGYLFNTTTFGKSAIGVAGYGCWASTKSFAGSMDPGDVIKVRAKTITLVANQGGGVTFSAMGTISQPVVFDIDDGTTWPADAPNPYLKIAGSYTGNTTFGFIPSVNTFAHIKGKRYTSITNDSLKRNLIFETTGSGGSVSGFFIQVGHAGVTWENLFMDAPGVGTGCFTQLRYTSGAGAAFRTRFVGCRQAWATPGGSGGFISTGINGNAQVALDSHEFVLYSATAPMPNLIQVFSGSGVVNLRVTDAKFIGFPVGSSLLGGSNNPAAGSEIIFKNCDFGGISVRGPILSGASNVTISNEMISSESKYGLRDFFVDKRNGFCEWNSQTTMPTATARLLDGSTPWSIYATTTNQTTNIGKTTPFEVPAINKINTLATGDRTVTMNFAVDSSLAWNRGDISFLVLYQDSTGAIRYVDTYDPTGTLAFAADTTTVWSVESSGQVLYNSKTLNKKQISITCTDIPLGAEISIIIRLHTAVDVSGKGVLIDPEIRVI